MAQCEQMLANGNRCSNEAIEGDAHCKEHWRIKFKRVARPAENPLPAPPSVVSVPPPEPVRVNNTGRPPIRVRLHMDIEIGEIEIIIDDDSPDRSENYHDRVARAIASYLSRDPEISDAGRIRYRFNGEQPTPPGGSGPNTSYNDFTQRGSHQRRELTE